MTEKRRLIEIAFPPETITGESARDKSIRLGLVDWGGYSGSVVEVTSDGVRIAGGGFTMFMSWGGYVHAHPVDAS